MRQVYKDMVNRNTELLSLTDKERTHALKNFLDSPAVSMLFTVRLALEEEFLIHLRKHPTTANCAMNFIAWLERSKYAERVGQALIKEAERNRIKA